MCRYMIIMVEKQNGIWKFNNNKESIYKQHKIDIVDYLFVVIVFINLHL